MAKVEAKIRDMERLKADGLIRDVFISNMEYVLAHAGA